MGFLEDVQAEQSARARPQTVCRVKRWLATQPDEVAAEFEAAMADTDHYTATAILKVMQSGKYPSPVDISLSSVQRHRRRDECECYRETGS